MTPLPDMSDPLKIVAVAFSLATADTEPISPCSIPASAALNTIKAVRASIGTFSPGPVDNEHRHAGHPLHAPNTRLLFSGSQLNTSSSSGSPTYSYAFIALPELEHTIDAASDAAKETLKWAARKESKFPPKTSRG